MDRPKARCFPVLLVSAAVLLPTAAAAAQQPGQTPNGSNQQNPPSTNPPQNPPNPPPPTVRGTIPVPMVFPRPDYYAAMSLFYQGNFAEALRQFRQQSLGAVRTANGSVWIDSIYYHTMIGACLEELGELPLALESYNRAAQIQLAYPTWGLGIHYWVPLHAIQGARVTSAPWGNSRRGAVPATYGQQHFPISLAALPFELRSYLDRTGQFTPGDLLFRDVVEGRVLLVDVPELVRCLALLTAGRNRILGPVAPHDPMTGQLLQAFQRGGFANGHWSESWRQLLLGLAYLGAGKPNQAKPLLQRATLMDGKFDHHLSDVALLALARLETQTGNWKDAQELFEEASYAAFFYSDPFTLAEALDGAAAAFQHENRQATLPAVTEAVRWARDARWVPRGVLRDEVAVELLRFHSAFLLADTRLRHVHASLLLTEADQQLRARNTRAGTQALAQARTALSRDKIDSPAMQARWEYLSARAAYQRGQLKPADEALARAVSLQSAISLRKHQLKLADTIAWEGRQLRFAGDLYPQVLLDPAPPEWWDDPLDLLARGSWPLSEPFEHWFHVMRARGKTREAWEVVERARAARFIASLPLGGRLLSLRWVLEAPESALDQTDRLERIHLYGRFPDYEQLVQQWRDGYRQLQMLPLAPDDVKQQQRQRQLLTALDQIDRSRDLLLREIACSREPSGTTFPPQLSFDEIRARLGDGRLLWSFFVSGGQVYSFWLSSDQFDAWQVARSEQLAVKVRALLRAMGHVRAGRTLRSDDLADDEWKTLAEELLGLLLQGRPVGRILQADEVVVVPDGVLWYVPFEALADKQIGDRDAVPTLLGRVRWRYAPTAALAFRGPSTRSVPRSTLVAMDRVRKKDEAAVWDDQLYDDLAAMGQPGDLLKVRSPVGPPLPPNLIDRLVVLGETTWNDQGPSAWQPLPPRSGRNVQATLADFVDRPWQGLTDVVLTGLHTPADKALADVDADAAGRDLFMASAAWMATGARTVVLSRWNVGGQSTRRLMREFLRELPRAPASEAWQRAVLLSARHELDPLEEPRLDDRAGGPLPRAAHPFFWAGYLLIDAGP